MFIPQSLVPCVLHLSHRAKMAGHPGGRRLYQLLRRSFFWPDMSVDCYTIVQRCVSCAGNSVNLRQNSKGTQLFPAAAPLEFMEIDILGKLLTTMCGNRFQLVTINWFSKLVKTVPLSNISASTVARAFMDSWVLFYGLPKLLLSHNGSYFTSKFFRHACRTLCMPNLFTTTYHPQCNGQVERFNRTIIKA